METHFSNNIKRGDVCAYVEVSLPVHNFNNSYLSECLTLEVSISNKKGYVITLYSKDLLVKQLMIFSLLSAI